METTCPQCSQRLRVRDDLKNPLLRCGRCGNMFRLQETAPAAFPSAADLPSSRPFESTRDQLTGPFSSDSDSRRVPEPELEPAGTPSSEFPTVDTSQRKAASSSPSMSKGGWGSIVIVLLVLMLKVGPRLARNFHRDRPAPPAPVHFNGAEQQDFQHAFQQLEREKEARRRNMHPIDLPEIPPIPPQPPMPANQ